jgi:acyl transferase domain-containing protein
VCHHEHWAKQLMAPVRFMEAMECVKSMGCSQVLQLGGSFSLLDSAKRCLTTNSNEDDALSFLPTLLIPVASPPVVPPVQRAPHLDKFLCKLRGRQMI